MKTLTPRMRIVLLSLAGGSAGYILLHPYTMLVYGLYGHSDSSDRQGIAAHLLASFADSFHPGMVSMGIPFALLGALLGMFLGLWLSARARRFEMEKQLLAAATFRQLTLTLAHHLLNAASVVGGFAARALRKEQDEDKKRSLARIREEARRIEAVVETLKDLDVVARERCATGTEALMIDIEKQLSEKLGSRDRPPA